jgi:hypothetical protein
MIKERSLKVNESMFKTTELTSKTWGWNPKGNN